MSPNGNFQVTGPAHYYMHDGSYTITVTIGHETSTPMAVATDSVTVNDALLGTSIGNPLLFTVGKTDNVDAVATFTDTNKFATASDFSVSINWGDGKTPTAGTVTQTANPVVNGSFETGDFSGWTSSHDPYAQIPVVQFGGAPGAGAFSAFLGNGNNSSPSNGEIALSQTVTLPVGASALTFCLNPNTADPGTAGNSQFVELIDAGSVVHFLVYQNSNAGVWTPYVFDTSAYSGQTVTLVFGVHQGGLVPGGLGVDAVSIQQFVVTDQTGHFYNAVSPVDEMNPSQVLPSPIATSITDIQSPVLPRSTATVIGSATVGPALVNGSFENGFTGWTVTPAANASTPTSLGPYLPTNGTHLAELLNEPNISVDTSAFESQPISGGAPNQGPGTNGTILTQTFMATAGQTISVDYNYIANDPGYDFGLGQVLNSTNTVIHTLFTADGTGFNTGWKTATFVVPSSGTYTLRFVVSNTVDNNGSSVLLLDNITVS
jgi:hypothetical protein